MYTGSSFLSYYEAEPLTFENPNYIYEVIYISIEIRDVMFIQYQVK